MKLFKSLAVVAAIAAVFAGSAQAQVRITEVAPWSSGNSPVGADWFEVTNFGASAVGISGWKVDDNSNSFGASVALTGITSIGAGQSVIFIEGTAATATSFVNNWFGGTAPAGFAIGTYSGSGIGLSTAGDAVNLFDGSGALQTRVDFGASPTASPFASFDNSIGANNVTLNNANLSVVGTNGAFSVIHTATEIGSPGAIAAVPEPETYGMLLAGLALIGGIARRRRAA
jgi:hypothetical protein